MTNQLVVVTIISLLATLALGLAEAGRGGGSSTSQWLGPHNQARRAVGLSPLRWDNKLAQYAQRYGNKRRNDCAMIHSYGPYGENIFWGSGTKWTPQQAVNGWVSEKRYYNRRSNSCNGPDCGHYLQIVWKNTKRVGCARIVCGGGRGVLFVCEYDPAGNWSGEKPY